MHRVLDEVAFGRYENALKIVSPATATDPVLANARGVCLMRMGMYDDSVALYRWLVLNPGQSLVRRDRPAYFKTNFATALLVAGNVDGCLHVLHQIHEDSPRIRQLREAISQWEAALTYWQKLDWWINRCVPSNRPVTIHFEPGEFGPVEQIVDDSPTIKESLASRRLPSK
jgi:hypothetical protein